MALSDGSREVIFVRQLLDKLIGFNMGPSELIGDNNGSLAVANNPANHQKTKHIQVRYHFVRQQIEDKVIVTIKAPTDLQLADVMTKALVSDSHWKLINLASGHTFGEH